MAITRARKRLYLSFARSRMLHGQTRFSLASRFLDEIPEELLKWLTPRFKGDARQGGFGGTGFGRSGYANQTTYTGSPAGGYAAQRTARNPVYAGTARAPTAFGTTGSAGGFRIGQNVNHSKFGAGVIVDAEGQGNDARVQVNFGREGLKWLAVSVAKLEAV